MRGSIIKNFNEKVRFIWSIADLLRGAYKPSQYGKIILPFTVLKRLDSVLLDTKEEVLEEFQSLKKDTVDKRIINAVLKNITNYNYYNTSYYTFSNNPNNLKIISSLKDDPENIKENIINFINGFSEDIAEIMERFKVRESIRELEEKNLLYLVIEKFIDGVNLHPKVVSNTEMGYIFEELIRRFSEQSNETAGEHFTPREVIRLMVDLLFIEDEVNLSKKGKITTLYDPACGTGGMLAVAEEYLSELNKDLKLYVYGQEINDEIYAVCKSDMLIKGQEADNIQLGNSFSEDKFQGDKFDYMLCNPPYGVEWKNVKDFVKKEAERGHSGRFGAGTPKISDGQLLFLQHMISKMKQNTKEGTRIGIVLNGSPLFSGKAGMGGSEIRKWIIENDWLEAIIALPDQLFYNTGIFTYIWIVTNRKSDLRRGKIQLINGIKLCKKLGKSLGNKRNIMSNDHIAQITQTYGDFSENSICKIFENDDFAYYDVTVERPLRLKFRLTKDNLKEICDEKGFQNLVKSKNGGIEQQKHIYNILIKLSETYQSHYFDSQIKFHEFLKKEFQRYNVKLTQSILKTITKRCGEKCKTAKPVVDGKGSPKPDKDLTDHEYIQKKVNIDEYFTKEVQPFVQDAWIDKTKTKEGYEIQFTRYFYEHEELRDMKEIEEEIKRVGVEIFHLLEKI